MLGLTTRACPLHLPARQSLPLLTGALCSLQGTPLLRPLCRPCRLYVPLIGRLSTLSRGGLENPRRMLRTSLRASLPGFLKKIGSRMLMLRAGVFTFLLMAFKRYIAGEHDRAHAAKRGAFHNSFHLIPVPRNPDRFRNQQITKPQRLFTKRVGPQLCSTKCFHGFETNLSFKDAGLSLKDCTSFHGYLPPGGMATRLRPGLPRGPLGLISPVFVSVTAKSSGARSPKQWPHLKTLRTKFVIFIVVLLTHPT